MKIVLFGDSLTFGYGVFNKDNLETLMKNEFKQPKFQIINRGINGHTSRDALARLKAHVLEEKPDVVTILFGTNDCSMGEGFVTEYEYRKNMKEIIESILKENIRIIMITPPPVNDNSFMPWTYNERLNPYCDIIRELSQLYNLELLDLNYHFSNNFNDEKEPLLQEDGCHLSEKGYYEFFMFLKTMF